MLSKNFESALSVKHGRLTYQLPLSFIVSYPCRKYAIFILIFYSLEVLIVESAKFHFSVFRNRLFMFTQATHTLNQFDIVIRPIPC